MRRDHPEAAVLYSEPALPAPAADVIAVLDPLLSDARRARIEAVVTRRLQSVVPVLLGVDDPHNVAAVLRSADVFGAQEVHLVEGAEPFMASQRVTQGSDRWLSLVRHPSAEACIADLRARDYRVYVATMDGETTPEQLAELARVAIFFGNERDGLPQAVMEQADGRYTIPMAGFAQSLNVSVAAAITLFAATRGRDGDLSDAQRKELRARFMMNSVERAEEVVRAQLGRRCP
ncbi:MAG: RNA methyltransferase [Myxococcales bacterium]|nr:RNA methyltransferase [Myxococcales bacterium]